MFDNLSQRLTGIFKNLTGTGRLTEANIRASLSEVRNSLLDADVAMPVVKQFIDQLTERAIGQEVLESLKPGDTLVKIAHEELTKVMGEKQVALNLQAAPPAVILLAGLQGSGKTTSAAKLARRLKEQEQKSVMVVSVDIYRPAAIKQLETLANDIGVTFFPSDSQQDPVQIVQQALTKAKSQFIDVLIVDTAGRLHIDDDMMQEVKRVHAAAQPVETLFVVDSMTGQDAVNSAKAFNEALPLTGVILSKTDGDARGGAALSVRMITGKPIKFLGIGEKTDALEVFHPERLASRILGMGDVLSLVEQVQQKVDKQKAEKLAKKFKKGKGFDFEDFLEQLEQLNNMGGLASLMGKIPGMGAMPAVKNQINDGKLKKMKAIIESMTFQERRFPVIIKGSRKQRIANGSGTQVQDVNQLLKQFLQMQKMMKKFSSKGGMAKMMRQFSSMMPGGGANGMPPFIGGEESIKN